VVAFWRETLQEYQHYVHKQLTLRRADTVKAFTLHNRKPAGLPDIIVRLGKDDSKEGTGQKGRFCHKELNNQWQHLQSRREISGIQACWGSLSKYCRLVLGLEDGGTY